MCSMGGGGAAGRKVMWVLMVAMLPGVVEAAGLVRDACKTFGGNYFDSAAATGVVRAPTRCLPRYGADARGVRHEMRTSPSACSPRTSRLPDCCVARALHHLVLHTLVRVLISLIACSHFAFLSSSLFLY